MTCLTVESYTLPFQIDLILWAGEREKKLCRFLVNGSTLIESGLLR